MSEPAPAPSRPGRHLVIVSGSGRSGTSTAAGALKKLGLVVPPPEIGANDTNPRGFFEPRWVVDFHKHWLAKARVRTNDARPEALNQVTTILRRPKPRQELSDWLSEQFSVPQVVVKDPRAFWFTDLWREAAERADARVGYLTMLRHPAEVIGSRGVHYLSDLSEAELRERETVLLAGWVNGVLANERATRNWPRVFVPYESLLEDWRRAMAEVAARLGLGFDHDLDPARHHAVDDFIDSDLHRVRVTWDDMSVPDQLQDLAERAWTALTALAEDPSDSVAMDMLDGCRESYDVMHSHAVAFARHATESEVSQVKREARREYRRAQVIESPTPARGSMLSSTRRRLASRAPRWLVTRLRSRRKGNA